MKLNNRKWMKLKHQLRKQRNKTGEQAREKWVYLDYFNRPIFQRHIYELFNVSLSLPSYPPSVNDVRSDWNSMIKWLIIKIVNKITDTLTQLTCVHDASHCIDADKFHMGIFYWHIYKKTSGSDTESKPGGFLALDTCFWIQSEN